MKVILWPGKGTIYTICEATWFGRTWFSPHHSFVKLVVKNLVEAERRGGVEKAAAESGVMKTQKFTWSKDGAKSFEWRKIYHALVGQVGPGEGGLLAEALITPTSMRTALRLVISNGFWLFFCFFSCVSFPFGWFLMFLVDLAAFWVLWILAWTWIFLSHLRAWRDLSRALRRMYTDHRVMGQVVLPGVSHVSLMAATASLGFPSPGGGMGDWHISVKEVLFERPYIVHSGADLIAAIANGVDPSTIQAMAGGLPLPMTPVGVPTTYCRSTTVTKERGIIKSTMDWAKWCSMTVWLQEELTN